MIMDSIPKRPLLSSRVPDFSILCSTDVSAIVAAVPADCGDPVLSSFGNALVNRPRHPTASVHRTGDQTTPTGRYSSLHLAADSRTIIGGHETWPRPDPDVYPARVAPIHQITWAVYLL